MPKASAETARRLTTARLGNVRRAAQGYHAFMTRTVASLIAGKPVDASATTLTIPNPANLDVVVAEAALADADTFLEACRVAKDAQRGWAATPAPVRGRAIQQFGRLVEDNFEALSALITREIGKPIAESRGEVQEVIDTCNFFLGEGRRLYGQTVPSEMPDKQLFTFRTPVGVAAIVTAGNFPVAVPSWYIVPALVCGNAVVWKPAEYTPATAEAFAQLLLHAGLPEGVFNLVLADGPQTFEGLERALDEGVLDKVGASANSRAGTCKTRASNSEARTPSWSCPTPTWTWRWRARCSAGSARPASAARRSVPRSSTHRSTTSSSHGSMPRSAELRSATRRRPCCTDR
jgi:aldehyde dehydrogenase (NAD+)